MDFPFAQNPWDSSFRPHYGRSFRGIPVKVVPEAAQPQSHKPKMVSIPVHSVGSERGRSDSAIKIQKVFRGFLVRKNVKKIMAIREQVNDIERSVSKTETADLIRNDPKQRLKVNENLMSLLFKLDSVEGVDSCVRDFRKSVIKKAIALQEMVDAIISGDQSLDSSNNAEVIDQNQGIILFSDNCNQTLESENHEEATEDVECVLNLSEAEGTVAVAVQGNDEESSNESQSDSFANHVVEGENGTWQPDNGKEGAEERRKEMLERITEENEKMMRMMETLSKRNEMQTRTLSALTQRVEQLEKAFLCDKLRRKKRRNDEKSQDIKKCGGKR
ncbi:hypothetical protein ERO13_A03G150100v2 [Gossypium hirsutum]|uniref:BAG family molecular chaperone regulator 6 n=1 Tax=Gossypium hirsutum TaxID=3635 RepID=A0A1U8HJK2_GOSHI|nr:BAG family molecular chaperone regulator 6-like [Gossypium hirsutum]KAG4208710.1 hypothetical protein ERO13_A03G150100v2 [Gossypium hirsutum]